MRKQKYLQNLKTLRQNKFSSNNILCCSIEMVHKMRHSFVVKIVLKQKHTKNTSTKYNLSFNIDKFGAFKWEFHIPFTQFKLYLYISFSKGKAKHYSFLIIVFLPILCCKS